MGLETLGARLVDEVVSRGRTVLALED
jgi:hypothetical protein